MATNNDINSATSAFLTAGTVSAGTFKAPATGTDYMTINANTILIDAYTYDVYITPKGTGVLKLTRITTSNVVLGAPSGGTGTATIIVNTFPGGPVQLALSYGRFLQGSGALSSASTMSCDSLMSPSSGSSKFTEGATLITYAAAKTADFTIAVNTGYVTNKTSLCLCTLPTTASVGDRINIICAHTTQKFKVVQNANQYIYVGSSTSTTGTGGYIQCTARYDVVKMVCVVANVGFQVISKVGTITVA